MLAVYYYGRDIGLGEIAVVLRFFLGAHGKSFPGRFIKAAGFLNYGLTAFDKLALTAEFVINGFCDKGKGIEVFHFTAGAQLRLAFFSYRKVDIAAQGAFVHFAIGDTYVEHNAAQLAKVCTHLIGGAHIGLTDNLDKRDSAAVIVNICTLGGVKELSGILFNMYPCYADFFGALRCFHG